MADLEPSLQTALADLSAWLEQESIPAVIVGGIAASLLGRPRLTRDIDALALLPEEDWARAVDSAAKHGIFPRISEPLAFARRSRVLLMRHARSAIDLDIIFGGLPFEQSVVDRAVTHAVGGAVVRLPRVEDLLIMKAVARRPKDLEDIRGLLDAHPQADVAEVRSFVSDFAAATGMADMLDELDKLLRQRRKD